MKTDIRQSLSATKAATFSVDLPSPSHGGMSTPTGTGFFVSGDGWFVTAAHVVTENNRSDGPPRTDLVDAFLIKEGQILDPHPGAMCQSPSLEFIDATTDFALLKVSFEGNSSKAWLQGRTSFPFIQVSTRPLEEGEPVYSFGYPLSSAEVHQQPGFSVGLTNRIPRVTSAVVASTRETYGPVMSSRDTVRYVMDKALNYGNSGGPIVAVESGNVHAFCSRFQPVFVPQDHLTTSTGEVFHVMMPSLYGVVVSLSNRVIIDQLHSRGVPIVTD